MLERILAFISSLMLSFLSLPETPTVRSVSLPEISLESVFNNDHGWTVTLSAEQKFTLIATGDVLTARTINKKSVETSNFDWMWLATKDFLSSGDVTFINLETPLIENCPISITGTVFCGDQRHVDGLVSTGVDVVNLANNHIGNFEKEGIDSTVALLDQVGIKHAGVQNPAMLIVNGKRISFLGFNDIYPESPGGYWAYAADVHSQITNATQSSDIVVVQFHWGNEYTTTVSQRQIELGHLAIDSGAELVIGNHPHWVQPIEIYKGKLITYAHGNFIFDQMWSEKTRQGVVGKYTFVGNRLVDAEFFPVYMQTDGSPVFASKDLGGKILQEFETESYKLQNRLPTQVTSGKVKSEE